MKVTIWVYTSHLKKLNSFIHEEDIEENSIWWLKFPDSVGEAPKMQLYVQVNLSYGDYVHLESNHSYRDLKI